MTDELDAISAALHGDKQAVLQEGLKNVHREILENIIVELGVRHDLHEEIHDLRAQMLSLTPSEGQVDNPSDRKDRLHLQDRVLDDQKELRGLRLKLIDINSMLSREERDLLSRLLETHLKDRRLREFDAS
jgi:hypothetical protein